MQFFIAAVLFTVLSVGLVVYGLRLQYAGRCYECGRSFAGGAAPLWCLNGHKIHAACAKHVMDREAIYGGNVSDFSG